jgi:phosphotransferase system enzyme I (PtsP)
MTRWIACAIDVDQMLTRVAMETRSSARCWRPTACSPTPSGWMRRMEEDIARGLSAEAAVEKEQSAARARMERCRTPTCATGCTISTTCRTVCCGMLTGQGQRYRGGMPPDPILVARNIGPAELLEYGRRLKGVVLEEGSVGSTPRSWRVRWRSRWSSTRPDHDRGAERRFHPGRWRPGHRASAPRGHRRLRLPRQAGDAGRGAGALRVDPRQAGEALCGTVVSLQMNAGLMADLPSLPSSGPRAWACSGPSFSS